ncbi:MAG TPA: HAD family phosphatase [Polyangiaceae bacterium]|jgi:beta-phosphoglucomutase
MHPLRGVIWDLDGTLVDTSELHFATWHRAVTERGVPFTRETFGAMFGLRNRETIARIFGPIPDAEALAIAARKESLYRETARERVSLLPGARDLLDALAREHVPCALGTSAPRENVELLLEATGTRSAFAAFACEQDVTEGKPAPDVFLVAARRLGADPHDCIVLEDAVVGIEAARSAGMRSVAVTFASHAKREDLAIADLVVGSLGEVTVESLRGVFRRERR